VGRVGLGFDWKTVLFDFLRSIIPDIKVFSHSLIMCSITNIRLISLVVLVLKTVVAMYLLGIGIYFASTNSIKQAFGNIFTLYGGGCAMCGSLSALIVYPTLLAIRKHNKFVLIVCFGVDTIVFLILLKLGFTFISITVPEFPKDLQLDCSLYERQIYTLDECMPFFQADRTAGFRLFWEGYFSDKSNTLSFEVLSTIESNACCGFYPPLECIENDAKFPSAYDQQGINNAFLVRRVTCGYEAGYYPEQDNCLNYYDEAAVPPIVGGCNYDLGVSYCLDYSVDSNSRGCVSFVEDYASDLILPHAYAIISLSVFNAVMMTLACCMWWKRKEHDVFPAFEDDFKVFPLHLNLVCMI